MTPDHAVASVDAVPALTPETAPEVPSLPEPAPDCPLCPRLAAHRRSLREKHPSWFNAPVPGFGPREARLAIIGLAPGQKGANRTGRVFTGDGAGELLFETLKTLSLAKGTYRARRDDGFALIDCRIINAVRCLPPENRPNMQEVKECARFLKAELNAMSGVKAVLALGHIAHKAVLKALSLPPSCFPFAHGARHQLPRVSFVLLNSYHCSRYNTSTGRLTADMFKEALLQAKMAAA